MKPFPGILFSILLIVSSCTFATVYYRHIPFAIKLKPTDKLIVNYDFSGKIGLTCSANGKDVLLNFIFKGHEKSAYLPIILQNAHVPDNTQEKLADIQGQFTIFPCNNMQSFQQFEVKCQYVS